MSHSLSNFEDHHEDDEIHGKLASVFSPATPIKDRTAFYGRRTELTRLREALSEPGMHLTLYGERGIGKTSLANVVINQIRQATSLYITCSETLGFTNLWRIIVKELSLQIEPAMLAAPKDSQAAQEKKHAAFQKACAGFLTATQTSSMDLDDILGLLASIEVPLIIILDEFDLAVKQESLASLFAETIKTFSDRLPRLTLMLVGIANSGKDLIGEHPSLERCLSQILLKRMDNDEMRELLAGSLSRIGLTIHSDVEELFLSLACGFPYYIHMLGKYSAESALEHRYTLITKNNLKVGVEKAVAHTFESIIASYRQAIRPQPTLPERARRIHGVMLHAAAQFKKDDSLFDGFGDEEVNDDETFSLADLLPKITLKETAFEISRSAYQQKLSRLFAQLTQPHRGAVLEKVPKKYSKEATTYRFRNPLLKAYILLKLYLV